MTRATGIFTPVTGCGSSVLAQGVVKAVVPVQVGQAEASASHFNAYGSQIAHQKVPGSVCSACAGGSVCVQRKQQTHQNSN